MEWYEIGLVIIIPLSWVAWYLLYYFTKKELERKNSLLEWEKHLLAQDLKFYKSASSLDTYSDMELKEELELRKLKSDYPLAYEIKNLNCEFVELYEDGKFKDKYTKAYAWNYVRKYGKDKDIVYKEVK